MSGLNRSAVVKGSLTTDWHEARSATVWDSLTVQLARAHQPTAEEYSVAQMARNHLAITEESSATQFRSVTKLIIHGKDGRHPTISVTSRKWSGCETVGGLSA